MDHLARGGGKVAADLERVLAGVAQLARADVIEHVPEAGKQVFAPRFHGPLEHQGIGQREIGRAHRVEEALRCELHSGAGRVVKPLQFLGAFHQLRRNRQIGLADGVEQRIVVPFGGREAAVGATGRRLSGTEHLAPGGKPLAPRLRARRKQRHRVGQRSRRAGGFGRIEPLGPALQKHLLRAAHDRSPMLPVLERRNGRGRSAGFASGVVGIGHTRGLSRSSAGVTP